MHKMDPENVENNVHSDLNIFFKIYYSYYFHDFEFIKIFYFLVPIFAALK